VCNSEIDREEDGERSSEGRADSGRKIALPRCPPLDSLDALDRQQQLDQERQRKPVPSPGARQTTQRGRRISQQKRGDHGASNASPINLAPPRVSSDRRMICRDQKNNGISVDDIIRWV
jgi:hypothetical protein